MRELEPRRRSARIEYDPTTGGVVMLAVVLVAVVLGVLAFNFQGSPRMDDLAKVQQGVTIPNPTELSPAETTGTAPVRR